MGKRIYTRTPLAERFRTKYEIDPESGCWNWTANIAPQGYGRIGADAPDYSTLYAHRVSYEIHLQAITQRENIDRSPAPEVQRRLADRCVRGHDLTDPAVVYIRPDTGRRQCKECQRIRDEAGRRRAGKMPQKYGRECGTYSGAIGHYRKGEPACDPCKAAAAAYQRSRRKVPSSGSWPGGDPPAEVLRTRQAQRAAS